MVKLNDITLHHYRSFWQARNLETLADDPVEARQSGLTPTKVNEKMLHDIQTVLSRLAGKAKQLLGNHTTNLAGPNLTGGGGGGG